MAADKLIYDVEYFTSSQVALYIGGVFIDEAAMISYAIQESKSPVYGYASRKFDAVIAGNVLVQGAIQLNFVDSGYVFAILQHTLRSGSAFPDGGIEGLRLASKLLASHSDAAPAVQDRALALLENGYADNLDRQRILGLLALASFDRADQQSRGLISVLGKTRSESQILSQQLEDELWGNPSQFSDLGSPFIPNPIDHSGIGFDIQVDYGFAEKYGNIVSRTPSFTRRVIRNCHIMGTTQIVDSRSGEPIQETIQFMARDYE